MFKISNNSNLLQALLFLIALHSFIAGLLLIVLSPEQLSFFGFEVQEKFFSTQGGVFHIVMSVAYVMGAMKPRESEQIITFAIIAKFIATFFLISYFLFKNSIWIVLLSGIGDFLMGVILLIVFQNFRSKQHAQKK